MATYFTADTHFFHERAIKFGKRPFSDAAAMNEGLIANWNARVSSKDDVWVLGDFAYRNLRGQIGPVFARLNGFKRLIIGNHDDADVLALPWHETPVLMQEVRSAHDRVVLCHYPLRDWNGMYRGAIHLFGHCHGNIADYSQCADVGVDRWNWYPVTLDDIKARIAGQPRNPDHKHGP